MIQKVKIDNLFISKMNGNNEPICNGVNCSIVPPFKCRKVTHVIFDLDGLLLDTEKIYERAISNILEEFGQLYTGDIKAKIIGTTDFDTSRIVVEELKLPISSEDFFQKLKMMVEGHFIKKTTLMPGAEKLVRHLHKHRIPIAVATSSEFWSYQNKISHHKDFFSLFNHVVTGATDPDVKNGKPAPDIFLTCATRFSDKPKPEHCLVFEDAPNGVTGAITAGMQVVMVPDKEISEEKCKRATVKFNSLEDVELQLFGLPDVV